jgi:tetratricopeptide (TPR) repeat protein
MLGRHEEAILECHKAIELDPNSPTAHYVLGRVYADQANYEESIAEFEKAKKAPAWRFAIGIGYAAAGRTDDVSKVLAELEQLEPTPWRAWWRATLNTLLGRKDEAFRWLNYERPHAWFPWIRVNKEFKPLRDDPRYAELLKRYNLPPPEE